MKMQGSFVDNLPKIYGLYTGGFIIFIGLMAILEQMGLGADTIGILFVAFTVVIYAAIGWLSRTDAGRCLLRRGAFGPTGVQRHGDGGGLDVRRVVRRHGRRHLHGRACLPRVRRRLDRRIRAGGGAHGAISPQVRLLHRARLHRHALRRQHRTLLRGARAGDRVVHLRDRADQRDRHHRVAGRCTYRSRSGSGSACSASCSVRCSAA